MTNILTVREQFARASLANYYATDKGDAEADAAALDIAAELARSAFEIFVTETKNHGQSTGVARAKAMVLFDEVTAEYKNAGERDFYIFNCIDAVTPILNFRNTVCELIDLIRDHPGTGAAKHLRPFLRSMAFDVPVEINLRHMARALDHQNFEKVILIMRQRLYSAWPDDYMSDEDLDALTDTKKSKENAGPEM